MVLEEQTFSSPAKQDGDTYLGFAHKFNFCLYGVRKTVFCIMDSTPWLAKWFWATIAIRYQ
jgi:hypothetical protein